MEKWRQEKLASKRWRMRARDGQVIRSIRCPGRQLTGITHARRYSASAPIGNLKGAPMRSYRPVRVCGASSFDERWIRARFLTPLFFALP